MTKESDLVASAAAFPPAAQPALVYGPWRAVADGLPEAGRSVLAFYRNTLGNGRIIRAEYAAPQTLPMGDEDGGWGADEGEDGEWCPPGWYETNEHEETHWRVDGEVTHWMPLPPRPGSSAWAHPAPPAQADPGERERVLTVECERLQGLADENDGYAKMHAAEVNELRAELAAVLDRDTVARDRERYFRWYNEAEDKAQQDRFRLAERIRELEDEVRRVRNDNGRLEDALFDAQVETAISAQTAARSSPVSPPVQQVEVER